MSTSDPVPPNVPPQDRPSAKDVSSDDYRKRERNRILNDDVRQTVVDMVLAGNYLETAAAAVGVTKRSLFRWLKLGKERPKSKYGRFRTAVREAVAKSEASDLARITSHGARSWQALAWKLERRFPDRWRLRTSVDHSGTVSVASLAAALAEAGKVPDISADEPEPGAAVPEGVAAAPPATP